MKRDKISWFLGFIVAAALLQGCGGGSSSSTKKDETAPPPTREYNFSQTENKIPTLVVVMNWNNFSESDPSYWHDKIFDYNTNSLNRYYFENLSGAIAFVEANETEGTANDGIVMVAMGKDHPGGNNDTTFRDVEIKNAITSADSFVNFAAYDTNNDGIVSANELQIFFAVAGGESAYSGSYTNSIWAHAWSFDSNNAPQLDGVYVMRAGASASTAGTYMRFGTNHGDHKATIGIIAHEVGHSLFGLIDFYDSSSGGSGLGFYDIMSDGAWGQKNSDSYPGQTPSQMSIYDKNETGTNTTLQQINSTTTVTLPCSKNKGVKLLTSKTDEYFLLSCRDTSMEYSDQSFESLGTGFTNNNLFMTLYHVDDTKTDNTENGAQTASNHYKMAFVEKDTTQLMTNTDKIAAEYKDVYVTGDVVPSSRLKLYDGTATGYTIEVLSSDYTAREMTIKVSK